MPRSPVLAVSLLLSLVASAGFAQAPPPPPPLNPLPPVPQPAGNPITAAKANLGKVLFWDEQLSSTRTVACGNCHLPMSGGADSRTQLGSAHSTNPGPDGIRLTADDINGSPGVVLNSADGSLQPSSIYGLAPQVTGRTTMSPINSAYSPELFWDGRAGGTFVDPETGTTALAAGAALETQVLSPPVSSIEMGHPGRSWVDVATRVASVLPLALSPSIPGPLATWIGGRSYAQLFEEAFGTAQVTGARIAMAIATYERTLVADRTPLDSLIAGTAPLRPDENAGLQLFRQLPCAGCHAGSLTTDNRFHFDGVRPAAEDSGRAIVTHNLADLGAMKTPSLRNSELRPAFMHDGRFTTLAQVVDFYDRGGDFNPAGSPAAHPLNLTALQKSQLLAFLERPLTDPRVAAGVEPFDRPTLFSEGWLVPEVLADGVPGSSGAAPEPVALEPAMTGNPAFTIGLSGAVGGAPAVLVVDSSLPPASEGIPATGSFARVPITLAGTGDSGGYGSVTLAIPDDPSIRSTVLYARWYVSDPGAAGGVAASPAVRIIVFGPYGTGGINAVPPGPTAIGARAMHLYASRPNPFPSSTTVRFDLFRSGDVRLDVFDVSGRRVRAVLDRRNLAPGNYSVVWDGNDDAGRSVPGGVYYYRFTAAGETQTSRVVRLR